MIGVHDRVKNPSTQEEGIVLIIGPKRIKVCLDNYMDKEGNFIIYEDKKDVWFEPKYLVVLETAEQIKEKNSEKHTI